MVLQNLALLLEGQIVQHLPEMLTQLPIQNLSLTFGDQRHLHSQRVWLKLSAVPMEPPLIVNLSCSRPRSLHYFSGTVKL